MKKLKFHRSGKAPQETPATQAAPVTNTKFDYAEVFLGRKELKNRHSVYISKDIHAGITRFVHLLALSGNEISIGGFIDNVLSEHMEAYKGHIGELCRKQLEGLQ